MSNTHSNVKNMKQINKSLKCLAEIILGQKSLNCRRFGICKMKPVEDKAVLPFSNFDCLAIISIEEEWVLNIEFLSDSIAESTYKKYFEDGVFKIGEDFEIPSSIAQKIGLKETFIIPPGVWRLDGLQLNLPMSCSHVLQAA